MLKCVAHHGGVSRFDCILIEIETLTTRDEGSPRC